MREHYSVPLQENELHIALRLQNIELLHLLLSATDPDDDILFDANSHGSNLLHYAVAHCDGTWVKYLIDRLRHHVLLALMAAQDVDGTPFHKV